MSGGTPDHQLAALAFEGAQPTIWFDELEPILRLGLGEVLGKSELQRPIYVRSSSGAGTRICQSVLVRSEMVSMAAILP